MEAIQLAKQVKELRDAQKKYFEFKKNGNVNTLTQLEICKKLERQLDKTISEILNPKENINQQSLLK